MGCGFFLMVLILAGIWGLSELHQKGYMQFFAENSKKWKAESSVREREETMDLQAFDWVRYNFLEAQFIKFGSQFDINGQQYRIGVMKGHNAFNATIMNYCFFKLSEKGIEEGFTDTEFITLLHRVLHLSEKQVSRTLIMAGMDPDAYERAQHRASH